MFDEHGANPTGAEGLTGCRVVAAMKRHTAKWSLEKAQPHGRAARAKGNVWLTTGPQRSIII